ncbi:N-acetyltransferase [Ancylobacter dichloromethanicus]|uniref:N-acetyltransferase n=1 Tax=Ancylobacter dichloromethanicus TaxID=518825 RepID=A0A9W6J4Q8_9HYPH|nr:N-acetyltransferase [Ancylobacter dichloromethanicus]MBS7553741.1 N-acetyltransferase [Ancylobacter dichloromethanicus]GLK70845.1 N-acetyltransferase [Ancylobacter dichloromethanicus]
MTELSISLLPENPADDAAIERLVARTFGPGRYARTAYRLRENNPHRRDLSFTAYIGTMLVGSVRLTPIVIGELPALLLGPLTVEPPFRSHGIGRRLVERSLVAAKAALEGEGAARLVLLVGDEPYYGSMGFQRVPHGQVSLPGPVDPARVLVCPLDATPMDVVRGAVRKDFARAPIQESA